MPNNIVARKWMLQRLKYERHQYYDCGELNSTKLAEDCANELDLCEGDEAEIPEWIFELAAFIDEPA